MVELNTTIQGLKCVGQYFRMSPGSTLAEGENVTTQFLIVIGQRSSRSDLSALQSSTELCRCGWFRCLQ